MALELLFLVTTISFFLCFIYLLISFKGSYIHSYVNSWWNRKPILLVASLFGAIVVVTPLAIGIVEFLLLKRINLVFSSGLGILYNWVEVSPGRAFLVPLVSAPTSSYLILIIILSAIPPGPKCKWLAKHFNGSLIGLLLIIYGVQSIGMYVAVTR